MENSMPRNGLVYGIRFEVKNTSTIRIWKPVYIPFYDFKSKCDCIVKYLIDEGFFDKKSCKVEVVT